MENFGDPARPNLDQLETRNGLHEVIRSAFAKADIGWSACRTEDRGDGTVVLVPPDVPKIQLATRMVTQLHTALRRSDSSRRTRIRLRIALHAGEVRHDDHGVAGQGITEAFRLIENSELKAKLGMSMGRLGIIVSDWFYDEVVRHYPAARPQDYRHVPATDGRSVRGWVRVPGSWPSPAGAGGCRAALPSRV